MFPNNLNLPSFSWSTPEQGSSATGAINLMNSPINPKTLIIISLTGILAILVVKKVLLK